MRFPFFLVKVLPGRCIAMMDILRAPFFTHIVGQSSLSYLSSFAVYSLTSFIPSFTGILDYRSLNHSDFSLSLSNPPWLWHPFVIVHPSLIVMSHYTYVIFDWRLLLFHWYFVNYSLLSFTNGLNHRSLSHSVFFTLLDWPL